MKRKLLLLSLCLALVLAFTQVAFAWGGGPRGFSTDGWVNMADLLGLSSEQAKQIQEIQQKAFNDMQALRTKMHQLMFELRSMQWQPGVTSDQVAPKIKELNELRQQMYEKRQQYREQLFSQLTDEQIAKMVKNGGCGFRGYCGGWRAAENNVQ